MKVDLNLRIQLQMDMLATTGNKVASIYNL
jgi:hypothetical protein